MEKKNYFYKVRLAYDSEAENPIITQEELPLVLWAFITKEDVVFSGGAFRGRDIISILPDIRANCGLYPTAKLYGEDWGEFRHIKPKADKILEDLKNACQKALQIQNPLWKTQEVAQVERRKLFFNQKEKLLLSN
jgi:hypothetical protein